MSITIYIRNEDEGWGKILGTVPSLLDVEHVIPMIERWGGCFGDLGDGEFALSGQFFANDTQAGFEVLVCSLDAEVDR